MALFQVFLPDSGRGLRFKTLAPSERDQILFNAAKQVGEEGNFVELRSVEQKMGVKAMLVSVTEKSDLTEQQVLQAPWHKFTLPELDETYDRIFSAKEHQVLCALFRQYHEVTAAELESITKKAVPVSEG
jgi:hypothetical protein